VGNIELKAKQEWIVKIKLKNNNYQLVQGLTLQNVCAPMPVVSTVRAVDALKSSDPGNKLLQDCCVPPIIGGEVDVILGIRYNNVGPRVIHHLESGLTIYGIDLATHDPSHNAAIGGPHCSLTAMLLNNGGNSKVSQTIKILFTQLSNYKLFGAPKIPHILLTKSEMSHVRSELFDELNFCD